MSRAAHQQTFDCITGGDFPMSLHHRTLAEAGELEFIRRIRELMPGEGGDIVRSAGDDCLVTLEPGGGYLLHTVDTFVDEIHFTRSYMTWGEIGSRCMAASVSDIAAMSGTPVHTLLSLSMPRALVLDDAVALFRGLAVTAESYGCPIAGGETTSTPGPLTVTVTVVGRVEPDRVVLRSGARAGDVVYMTGFPGEAMAGLEVFKHGMPGFERLRRAFVRPDAKVAVSRELTARFEISAMIDLSDGLATDIGHICEESGCGAMVREASLPLTDAFIGFVKGIGRDPMDFAISGGEEYGLLFTSSDPGLEGVNEVLGEMVTCIGMVTDRAGMLERMRPEGAIVPLTLRGYEHFRP